MFMAGLTSSGALMSIAIRYKDMLENLEQRCLRGTYLRGGPCGRISVYANYQGSEFTLDFASIYTDLISSVPPCTSIPFSLWIT